MMPPARAWIGANPIHGRTEMQMPLDPAALVRTFGLFFATAVAELLGCYLPLLWLTGRGSAWLALPAAASLAVFVWLLTLLRDASGRVYAMYGAVYIATAIAWLYVVDGVAPTWNDYLGVGLTLGSAVIIALGRRLG
jgi:small multidrug resistance family-3 protein